MIHDDARSVRRRLFRAWRNGLGGVAGLLLVGGAYGEQGVDSSNSPLRCLSKPSIDELEKAAPPSADVAAGVVRLRLMFESPVTPPRVTVLFDSVGEGRSRAVLDYVSGYRLPCMSTDGGAVVGQQEFSFKPFRESNVRESYERLEKLHSCITGLEPLPQYPYSQIREVRDGVVFAAASFSAPNQPPNVRILYDGGERRFGSVVNEYFSGLRITCGEALEFPITLARTFKFLVEGDSQQILKDLSLQTFLSALDQPERTHPRFDFSSMDCPFDIRFELREPFLQNQVREIGTRDPNRREFLEWLKTSTFKIPESKVKPLIGQEMKIHVPCLVLDLR